MSEQFAIRNATEKEYNYWMNLSMEQQIDDRLLVFNGSYEDAKAKVYQMQKELHPNGVNTEKHYFYVLDTLENKNIAFTWFGEFDGVPKGNVLLCEIMVNPNFRRQGHARRLLNELQPKMFELGYDAIYLNVMKRNFAQDLYLSLGYKVIKEMEHNYHMILNK